MTQDDLAAAVAETIAAHPDRVLSWQAREPGAWGMLATHGVLAYRSRLGRRLTDGERRSTWSALWAALESLESRR